MKKQILVCAISLGLCVPALAMPNIVGTYRCEGNEIKLTTTDGLLFVEGLDTGATSNQGIPCSNETVEESFQGYFIKLKTVCNEEMLSGDTYIIHTPSVTNVRVFLSFTKLKKKKLELNVKISGLANGQVAEGDMAVTCSKI